MNPVSEIQQLMDKLNTTTPDLQEIDAELAEDAGFKLFLKASKASVLPKVKLPPRTEDKKQKELQAAMLVCELMWHSQSMEEKASGTLKAERNRQPRSRSLPSLLTTTAPIQRTSLRLTTTLQVAVAVAHRPTAAAALLLLYVVLLLLHQQLML
jgi:hypothetical protein